VQVPSLVRFEINRGNSLFPRVTGPERCPAQPGERRFIRDCIHLGYVSNFLIIRRVPQYSIRTINRQYCHQWQQPSNIVATFVASITDTSHECDKPGGRKDNHRKAGSQLHTALGLMSMKTSNKKLGTSQQVQEQLGHQKKGKT
jgi:hypothetical protein